jgi:hypothetical protein
MNPVTLSVRSIQHLQRFFRDGEIKLPQGGGLKNEDARRSANFLIVLGFSPTFQDFSTGRKVIFSIHKLSKIYEKTITNP